MNPCVISRALLSRIKADTGSGGLFSASGGTAFNIITSANMNMAGRTTSLAFPYLIWTVRMADDHVQGSMMSLATVTFQAHDDSDNANANLEAIIDRLTGDAVLASGEWGVPTYGFHNHLLVLPTNALGATTSNMRRTSADVTPTDQNYLAATVVFEVHTTATAVNP